MDWGSHSYKIPVCLSAFCCCCMRAAIYLTHQKRNLTKEFQTSIIPLFGDIYSLPLFLHRENSDKYPTDQGCFPQPKKSIKYSFETIDIQNPWNLLSWKTITAFPPNLFNPRKTWHMYLCIDVSKSKHKSVPFIQCIKAHGCF